MWITTLACKDRAKLLRPPLQQINQNSVALSSQALKADDPAKDGVAMSTIAVLKSDDPAKDGVAYSPPAVLKSDDPAKDGVAYLPPAVLESDDPAKDGVAISTMAMLKAGDLALKSDGSILTLDPKKMIGHLSRIDFTPVLLLGLLHVHLGPVLSGKAVSAAAYILTEADLPDAVRPIRPYLMTIVETEVQFASGIHTLTEESLQMLNVQCSACLIPVARAGFITNRGPVSRLNEPKKAGYFLHYSTAGDVKIAYDEEKADGNTTTLRKDRER